jgi:hypothetical protein
VVDRPLDLVVGGVGLEVHLERRGTELGVPQRGQLGALVRAELVDLVGADALAVEDEGRGDLLERRLPLVADLDDELDPFVCEGQPRHRSDGRREPVLGVAGGGRGRGHQRRRQQRQA